MQLAAEEIESGGETAHGVRCAEDPCALALGLRGVRAGRLLLEHADERELRRGLLQFEILRAIDGHRHVRLSRAEPDFADEHILDGDGVLPLHLKRRDLARLEPGKFHHPFTVRAGLGGFALTGYADGDLLARVGPTPNRHGGIPLKDQVIGEYGGQFHVRAHGRESAEQRSKTHQTEDRWADGFHAVRLAGKGWYWRRRNSRRSSLQRLIVARGELRKEVVFIEREMLRQQDGHGPLLWVNAGVGGQIGRASW